jgi:hypothetical protein
MQRTAALLCAVIVLAGAADAQWLHSPDPRVPRAADGTPDLTAAAPKSPDGHVDLAGVWIVDFHKSDPTSPAQPFAGEDPVVRLFTVDGMPVPFLAGIETALRNLGPITPATRCMPHSIVDSVLVPSPFKIVQTPGITLLLLEEFNHFREIYTDGRPFPTDMQPAWFGYSVGRWDGDAFVVETRGLNDRARSGGLVGGPLLVTTETLHLTERYRRPDVGTLALDVTFDDPTSFSHPWTTKTVWFRLLPDSGLIEYICDNEKDAERIKTAN